MHLLGLWLSLWEQAARVIGEQLVSYQEDKQELQIKPTFGKFLRLKEVLEIIPVSKSTWWAGIKTGRFPKPVKLSDRVTVWKLQDIEKIG